MLLDDALAHFVLQLQADGRSPHTVRQYQRHVRTLARWAADVGHSGHVEDLDHTAIARFMTAPCARIRPDGRAKRATSVNALRTSLRCFFVYMHDVDMVSTNPACRLRRARPSPPPVRGVADGDLQALVATLDAADGPAARRDLALVRLLAESGMRLGSAVALDVEDLDLVRHEASLRSAKGDHRQMVVLPKGLCAHLRDYLGDRTAGPLFPGRGGGRISTRQVQRRLAMWLERAGVKRGATVHSLRHHFAIRLYRATGDIYLVQQALGHRSIASTTVYARADRSRLAAAIGA
jgi:integrase/recombinase XerC